MPSLEKTIKQLPKDAALPPTTHLKVSVMAYVEANPFHRPAPRLRYVVAFAVVVVFCASGTVFAAQNTIPGDALYSVKRVSENAYTAVLPTPQAKMAMSEMLIDRRFNEAAKVIDEDNDNDETMEARLVDDVAATSDEWVNLQEARFVSVFNENIKDLDREDAALSLER